MHDVEALRAGGLARGGGLDNAVVVDGGRVLNPHGLRFADEFVRHKALDLLGDLYVLGLPIVGRFEATRPGHALNNALARALAAHPGAWRVCGSAMEFARAELTSAARCGGLSRFRRRRVGAMFPAHVDTAESPRASSRAAPPVRKPTLSEVSLRADIRPVSLRVSTAAMAIALAATVALGGCAGKKKAKVDLSYQERPVELLYSTGAAKLDRHQWNEAVSYFDEVERQHPYSEWARRSILMEAFAHYQANKYDDAIAAADRFISLYPGKPSTAYAYYLKAQCWFEQIADVGRDQAATEQALASLRRGAPPLSAQRIRRRRQAEDRHGPGPAGRQGDGGRPLVRAARTQPVAAIGRFKTVIDRYQTTSHTPEALYRLVEANLYLGLLDEAQKDGAVLGYNFPGDPWYQQAYALLTSKGLRPQVEPRTRRGGLFGRRPAKAAPAKTVAAKGPDGKAPDAGAPASVPRPAAAAKAADQPVAKS